MGLDTLTPLSLYLADGILNLVRYRDKVLWPVLPALRNPGPGAISEDDNMPAYRACIVTAFLVQHQAVRMASSAFSPDLNPIEHFWDIIRSISGLTIFYPRTWPGGFKFFKLNGLLFHRQSLEPLWGPCVTDTLFVSKHGLDTQETFENLLLI